MASHQVRHWLDEWHEPTAAHVYTQYMYLQRMPTHNTYICIACLHTTRVSCNWKTRAILCCVRVRTSSRPWNTAVSAAKDQKGFKVHWFQSVPHRFDLRAQGNRKTHHLYMLCTLGVSMCLSCILLCSHVDAPFGGFGCVCVLFLCAAQSVCRDDTSRGHGS